MNIPILPCSCCGQPPVVKTHILPFSVGYPKPSTKYQIECEPCANKTRAHEYAYFSTFTWNTEAMAIGDWNAAVENNNSWLEKKLQQAHEL